MPDFLSIEQIIGARQLSKMKGVHPAHAIRFAGRSSNPFPQQISDLIADDRLLTSIQRRPPPLRSSRHRTKYPNHPRLLLTEAPSPDLPSSPLFDPLNSSRLLWRLNSPRTASSSPSTLLTRSDSVSSNLIHHQPPARSRSGDGYSYISPPTSIDATLDCKP